MKYNYLFLLLSLVFLSCNEHSEKDYSILSKNYEDKNNENVKNYKIVDSLRESINKMSTESVGTPLKENDTLVDNEKSTFNKIRNQDKLLKDSFFDKYDYANYIKILPKTYYVTVIKNNVKKNYICQYLEAINDSNSKYIFTPTNKTIIDIHEKYNKENTKKDLLHDLWDD